jgi:hypothetical protein
MEAVRVEKSASGFNVRKYYITSLSGSGSRILEPITARMKVIKTMRNVTSMICTVDITIAFNVFMICMELLHT